MPKERTYEKLIVWREAHALCLRIYELLPHLPAEERFCISSQMRRSAYSVPMNIVEGNYRKSLKEKIRFLEIAESSLEELDYQLLLCRDLQYVSRDNFSSLREAVGRVGYLLMQLRKGIRRKNE